MKPNDRLGVQQVPQRVVPGLHLLGLGDQRVVQRLRLLQPLGQVDHAHRHVLHQDLEVVPALPAAQRRVHLGGLGVDQPGLQQLAVAGEQRVGQRAVTPEDAVAVQFDQQPGHRVQQPRPVLG